jgi:hypothetical protein
VRVMFVAQPSWLWRQQARCREQADHTRFTDKCAAISVRDSKKACVYNIASTTNRVDDGR